MFFGDFEFFSDGFVLFTVKGEVLTVTMGISFVNKLYIIFTLVYYRIWRLTRCMYLGEPDQVRLDIVDGLVLPIIEWALLPGGEVGNVDGP